MSIYFDTRDFGTLEFTEPEPLLTSRPPAKRVLYAFLVEDLRWTPRPFRPPYFGQTRESAQRGFPFQHHAVRKWLARGESIRSLWIAWRAMPYSFEHEREAIEDQLIEQYKPELNDRLNRPRTTETTWNPYLHPSAIHSQLESLLQPSPASTGGLGLLGTALRRPTTPLRSVTIHHGIGAFGSKFGKGIF